jgi:uncharacterized 2Fe-2S/4Fe-4S cluster protein (DUF4445 family)
MPAIEIYQNGLLCTAISPTPGENCLQAVLRAGLYLDAPCGGRGRCGKCLIAIQTGEIVRACQTPAEGVTKIILQDTVSMEIQESGGAAEKKAQARSSFAGQRLGCAIDIGTTTVVCHLHDLDSGARIATASGVNAQRAYGADVVSRIEYSAKFGHEELTKLIQNQLNGLISDAAKKAGAAATSISRVVIAGNTIMQHLAAGLSPAGMGTVPFTPVSLFGGPVPQWEGFPGSADCEILFAPCVAPYVGGDITAGLLQTDADRATETTFFIDIGTNGEMAIAHEGRILVCATAAGPAFEGAEITCGGAAVTGAVQKLSWNEAEEKLSITTIGGAEPNSICGSGLIDTVAVLIKTGACEDSGKLLEADELDHPIAKHLREYEGKPAFYLTDSVFLTAADIRKIQLAKAAIAGGIMTLLREVAVKPGQVRRFCLAGGFGSFIEKESAAAIGLFPDEFLPVCQSLGNTAGEGAAQALLSEASWQRLLAVDDKCEYLELSTSAVFNEEFVENMFFY